MVSGGTVVRFREPIRAEPRQKDKSGNNRVDPEVTTPVFSTLPVFFVPRLDPLLVFDGLAVFHHRGIKNTGYDWLSPATAQLQK